MAKDPAFLFYSQDFYTGVATLNWEDRGKYISILCLMHQQGRMKEETIRFLVGSISDNLKSKFKIDDKGFWYNSRLEQESEKRAKFTESRRNNGNLGGRPSKQKPIGKPKHKHKGNLMEDDNENRNENKDGNEIQQPEIEKNELQLALDSWIEMRKKMKGGITEHAIGLGKSELKKLSGGNTETAIAIINQSILNSWKGFFPLSNTKNGNKLRKGEPDIEGITSAAHEILRVHNLSKDGGGN